MCYRVKSLHQKLCTQASRDGIYLQRIVNFNPRSSLYWQEEDPAAAVRLGGTGNCVICRAVPDGVPGGRLHHPSLPARLLYRPLRVWAHQETPDRQTLWPRPLLPQEIGVQVLRWRGEV